MNTESSSAHNEVRPPQAMREFRHDLLSLLNQVLGYSYLVEEEASDGGYESVVKDIQKIQKVGKSMERLIADQLVNAWPQDLPNVSEEVQPQKKSEDSATVVDEESNDVVADFDGRVLVVDDEEANRSMLCRQLSRLGLDAQSAASGDDAIERLKESSFDLVLLDVMMPGLSGLEVLNLMKQSEAMRHLPVLMVSALGEMDIVCKCIESGAEDFLPKPIQATLLRSRVGACIEKKRSRDREQTYLKEIERTQQRLASELKEAADYLHSVFPEEIQNPFPVHWKHVPCSELAGDAFGYHWIDEDHFAIYILDVSGHGVRAALLAASAINVIRSKMVKGIDWHDPGQVLQTMNNMFLMERQNHLFFTMWYGVYNRRTHQLKYSGAGHPSAMIVTEDGHLVELESNGLIVGVMEDQEYQTEKIEIPEASTIYLITDGCFEVIGENGPLLDVDDLLSFIKDRKNRGDIIQDWYQTVKDRHPEQILDDDFTMLAASFRDRSEPSLA